MSYTRLATVYATDENVAIRATGDFQALCPDWQKLASGADGVVSSGSPWVLTSATVNFGAQGVQPGNVVVLKGKTGTGSAGLFAASGEMMAVDAVSGNSLTLRRLGQDSGAGQPLPAGTAILFQVSTLGPQIEEASFDLNRRFAIDPLIPTRTPADLFDPRELRQACVLGVLKDRYAAETRSEKGDFPSKLKVIWQQHSDLLSRLTLRWQQAAASGLPKSTTWLSTRIVR